MDIKLILATSINCKIFEKRVLEAVSVKGIDVNIEVNPSDAMKYGIIYTPAIVINGTVVSSGKMLTTEAIGRLIQ